MSKMDTCYSCGKPVSYNAWSCPHCGGWNGGKGPGKQRQSDTNDAMALSCLIIIAFLVFTAIASFS